VLAEGVGNDMGGADAAHSQSLIFIRFCVVPRDEIHRRVLSELHGCEVRAGVDNPSPRRELQATLGDGNKGDLRGKRGSLLGSVGGFARLGILGRQE
jgi:hypothetical protein